MAQQWIGPGPGNLVPETELRSFLSAATIVKGDVIAFSGATGYTVALATDVLPPIGVAAEAAASGDWFDVVVGGFCSAVICTTADVGDKDMLQSVAAGECVGVAYGTDVGAGGEQGTIFGHSLQAQTGTLITQAWIYKKI